MAQLRKQISAQVLAQFTITLNVNYNYCMQQPQMKFQKQGKEVATPELDLRIRSMWQELGFSYKSDFKVGDVVNAIWKDINGVGNNKYYNAEVLEIKDNGNIKVEWLNDYSSSILQPEKILYSLDQSNSSLGMRFRHFQIVFGTVCSEEITRDYKYNEGRENLGKPQNLLQVKLGEIGVPAQESDSWTQTAKMEALDKLIKIMKLYFNLRGFLKNQSQKPNLAVDFPPVHYFRWEINAFEGDLSVKEKAYLDELIRTKPQQSYTALTVKFSVVRGVQELVEQLKYKSKRVMELNF